MGGSKWVLELLVLVWCCNFQCLASGIESFLDGVSNLQCRPSDMRFSLPSMPKDFASVLTVLDYMGNSQDLRNDSICGLWVGQNLDGSMTIGAAYHGCYVREEHGDHVVTMIMELIRNGQVEHQKKDIKCASLPALDAPSPSDCAAVQVSDRLLCANSSVPQDVCEQVGCCFSPGNQPQCYYGNKLTAQCTEDGQVRIILSKDLTEPSLLFELVSVIGVDSSSCSQMMTTNNSAFLMFQFPLSCGGGSRISGNSLVYENTVVAAMDVRTWKGSSISRDSTVRLTVRCSYSQIGNLPLQAEVLTLPPPLPVSTSGPLTMEMRIAKDETYASYYVDSDYPVTKLLRDPVFLEVHVLGRTDPNLILMLDDCWTTPTPSPTAQVQWPILVNGCPFPGDDYMTMKLPVAAPSQSVLYPTHYQRFLVDAFTFVDPNNQNSLGGLVYFHCSAAVCVPSATESCSVSCGQRKKRATKESRDSVTVSRGPVNFIEPGISLHMNLSNSTQAGDTWDYDEVQQDTSLPGFVGAEKEGPMDEGLTDMGKNLPKPAKGFDPASATMMWIRAAAVGGGVLAIVAVLGVWRCNRITSPTVYSVKI